MEQSIEIDDQESAPNDDEPADEDIPTTSSELEHHSESESRNSTKSITGSLIEEHFENGRRYCSETYFMPNDEAEQTRLAIVHQSYLPLLDEQLTLSTIPRSARRILDIGTGAGDWAVAVAERFPKAEIIATDITNAFQPASAPPNLFFEFDDAQNEWAYNDSFHFIHIRNLSGAFSNWGAIYAEVSKHLRRGGLLEIAECGLIQFKKEMPNSNTSIFNGAIQSAADKSGKPLNLDHLKKSMFGNAGLSVIKTRVFEVPLGTYDPDPRKKLTGKMAMIATLEGLEARSLRLLTKYLGWTEKGVKELCTKVREEILRPDARAFIHIHFVIARRMV